MFWCCWETVLTCQSGSCWCRCYHSLRSVTGYVVMCDAMWRDSRDTSWEHRDPAPPRPAGALCHLTLAQLTIHSSAPPPPGLGLNTYFQNIAVTILRDPHCTGHSTYSWWQRLIDWDVIFVFQILQKWFNPILDSTHLHNKLSESGQNLCMSPDKARMWRRDRCEDDQRSELYSCTLSTSGTIGQFDLNLENSYWIVNPVIRRL